TIRSYRAHRAKGAVMMDVVRAWALPAVIGIAIGSVIAYFAPSAVFKIVFMTVVTLIGLKLLFGRDDWRIADELPGRATMAGYGFLIGLTSSFMGVSGGSISNIIQTLYGKPLHNAVATSSGLGVPITIGVAIMAPVSSFMAPYGARLAHRLSKRALEIGFGVFLLLVSARFVLTLI